jgi:hypothetical protein
MDHDQQNSPAESTRAVAPDRRPWNAPRLIRIKAGEAEIGSNPIMPEGPIAKGS